MFVLGNSTWCHGEMLLQSHSHVWTIRWWPVVGGASRHSCSKDRSFISPKGYRKDRRLKVVEGSELGIIRKRENGTNPSLLLLIWY